jgi:hypothetical protein
MSKVTRITFVIQKGLCTDSGLWSGLEFILHKYRCTEQIASLALPIWVPARFLYYLWTYGLPSAAVEEEHTTDRQTHPIRPFRSKSHTSRLLPLTYFDKYFCKYISILGISTRITFSSYVRVIYVLYIQLWFFKLEKTTTTRDQRSDHRQILKKPGSWMFNYALFWVGNI